MGKIYDYKLGLQIKVFLIKFNHLEITCLPLKEPQNV